MKPILKRILLLSSVLCLSLPIFSDVDTTSGMRGSVNVSGATVVAEHTPQVLLRPQLQVLLGVFHFRFCLSVVLIQ